MSHILVANGGSSSLRLAVFAVAQPSPTLLLRVKVEGIGQRSASLQVSDHVGCTLLKAPVSAADLRGSIDLALQQIASRGLLDVGAIGHRIVHGMQHTESVRVTTSLMTELRSYTPMAPEHLPGELDTIDALLARLPDVPQFACFDTAFHRGMPRVATLLPIPRHLQTGDLQRYGFHGISYAFLMTELARLGDPAATRGRVVLAHLGNGASVTAVRDGRSIDTSMGFTPASGLMMGTRTGDIDPGLFYYLSDRLGMTPADIQKMASHASGLLGVSERSADVRDLLAFEGADFRSAEALALFCYQAKKWIGAMAAALGGLDTLVFSGGIGENASSLRARICDDLSFLGIRLDEQANAGTADIISARDSPVTVRVVHTDEELMIARDVCRHLQ